MKKIGIYITSEFTNKFFYEMVSALNSSNKIELYFVTIKDLKKVNTFKDACYQRLIDMEAKVLSLFSKKFKKPLYNLSDFSDIRLINLQSDKLNEIGLDLIVQADNFLGIEKVLMNNAKDGVITFGNNNIAFWAVYFSLPSTEFYIELWTNQFTQGKILFKGSTRTKGCHSENILTFLNSKNSYMSDIILEYVKNNKFTLPLKEILNSKKFKTPKFYQLFYYCFKVGKVFISLAVQKKLLKKSERWSVAFLNTFWEEASLSKGTVIKNLPNHFFADPFVHTKDAKTICFVEDYNYIDKKGSIRAIELVDAKSYVILDTVIEEPFHMSFPYLFEYDDELYMVPETSENNAIRLYKCIEYPLKWQYQKNLMSDIKVVDTMIFKHEERWWLLCNGQRDNGLSLMAFYTDNPLSGDWVEHNANPLVFDISKGRNGGVLYDRESNPIRVRQKSEFNQYGKSFSLAKIKELTINSFKEEEIKKVNPNFFKDIKGCHHMHSNGEFTVYDILKSEAINK